MIDLKKLRMEAEKTLFRALEATYISREHNTLGGENWKGIEIPDWNVRLQAVGVILSMSEGREAIDLDQTPEEIKYTP